MTRPEKTKTVRDNCRRLFREAWEVQKAQGVPFHEFCETYGMLEKNFKLFLETGADVNIERFVDLDPFSLD